MCGLLEVSRSIGGRADDTIIRSGENIAPAEIEAVLVEHDDVRVEHDDVRACAVVGAEDPEWGQVIAAVVVPHTGSHPGRANPAVRTLAPARLPYARPVRISRRLADQRHRQVVRRDLVAEVRSAPR
jgi:acyl-CoA synthetase (AMP-forming)/AMP-acid ligase II